MKKMDILHIGINNNENINSLCSSVFYDAEILTNRITETYKIYLYRQNHEIPIACLHFFAESSFDLLRQFLTANTLTEKIPKSFSGKFKQLFHNCLNYIMFNNYIKIVSHNQIKSCISENKELLPIYLQYLDFCRKIRKYILKHNIPNIAASKTTFNTPWPENNVLIGPLRNQAQLEICLKHKFYHMPENRFTEPQMPKYIAIYQSKHLFGNSAGVRYYGEIINISKVKRCDIKEIPSNSGETYFYFSIKEWKTLPKIIKADSDGGLFGITNIFLLLHSRMIFELYLKRDEYNLYKSISDSVANNTDGEIITFRDIIITVQNGTIILYKYDCPYAKFRTDDFIKSPKQLIKNIVKKSEE